ncbi:hypothetical protein ABBQ38_008215 [Trebouxia sp. C0009 RCD-2024]
MTADWNDDIWDCRLGEIAGPVHADGLRLPTIPPEAVFLVDRKGLRGPWGSARLGVWLLIQALYLLCQEMRSCHLLLPLREPTPHPSHSSPDTLVCADSSNDTASIWVRKAVSVSRWLQRQQHALR